MTGKPVQTKLGMDTVIVYNLLPLCDQVSSLWNNG